MGIDLVVQNLIHNNSLLPRQRGSLVGYANVYPLLHSTQGAVTQYEDHVDMKE